MLSTIRRARSHRAISTLVLMLFIPGCMHWKTVSPEPQRLPAAEQVRVTFETGERRTVRGAYFYQDSLMSSTTSPIPKERITGLEVRSVDGVATGAVIATGVLALVVVAAMSVPRDIGKGWGCLAMCSP